MKRGSTAAPRTQDMTKHWLYRLMVSFRGSNTLPKIHFDLGFLVLNANEGQSHKCQFNTSFAKGSSTNVKCWHSARNLHLNLKMTWSLSKGTWRTHWLGETLGKQCSNRHWEKKLGTCHKLLNENLEDLLLCRHNKDWARQCSERNQVRRSCRIDGIPSSSTNQLLCLHTHGVHSATTYPHIINVCSETHSNSDAA